MRSLALFLLAFGTGSVVSEAIVVGHEPLTVTHAKLGVFGVMLLVGLFLSLIERYRSERKEINDILRLLRPSDTPDA